MVGWGVKNRENLVVPVPSVGKKHLTRTCLDAEDDDVAAAVAVLSSVSNPISKIFSERAAAEVASG